MKKFFFIILILKVLSIKAQDSIVKRFVLSANIEHRLPNVFENAGTASFDSNIGRTSLGLSIYANIYKGFYLGFMESVKYAPYGYTYIEHGNNSSLVYDKRKLLLDYKLFLGKHIRFNKAKALDLRLGIGKMDIGGYFYVMDTQRNVLKIDIQHFGYNFETGYFYKGFSAGIGYYYIPHFYKGFPVNGANKAGILYIHTRFNLFKF